MKARTAGKTATTSIYVCFSALLVAGFPYLFLAGQAVSDVARLHQSLHLNVLMPLDLVFTAGHIFVYGALTLLLCRPGRSVQVWMMVAVWLGIVGIAVELAQEIIGSRTFGLGDMLANFAGISLALTYRCMARRSGHR